MKGSNIYLQKYQALQRSGTLAAVDEAIISLKDANRDVTISSIASELGCSRQRLHAPYVQAHLQKYPEFNTDLRKLIELENSTVHSEENFVRIMAENASLKKSLQQIKDQRVKLLRENKQLSQKFKTLDEEVQILRDKVYELQRSKIIHI